MRTLWIFASCHSWSHSASLVAKRDLGTCRSASYSHYFNFLDCTARLPLQHTVQNACRMSTVYPAVSTEGDAILDRMSWKLVHKGEICSQPSHARLMRMTQTPQCRIGCAIRASWFLNTLSLEVLSEHPQLCAPRTVLRFNIWTVGICEFRHNHKQRQL